MTKINGRWDHSDRLQIVGKKGKVKGDDYSKEFNKIYIVK